MTQIAVIVGSLRADSLNKKLAQNLEELAPVGTKFVYADVSALPLFNQDIETEFPAAAQALKDTLEAADGILLVTPEHNRSMTSVMKNAIDWASRPWGSNSFSGKPAGVVGASMSPLGTAVAQAHLKSVMVYLNTKLMGQPEIFLTGAQDAFDEDGAVIESSKDHLKRYIEAFVAHVESQK